jgi:hypothetical protein
VRSNSAILLVTCAIALAAPSADAESNKPGEGPNLTVAQLIGTWKGMQCESTQGSAVSRRRQFVMTETTCPSATRIRSPLADAPACRDPDRLETLHYALGNRRPVAWSRPLSKIRRKLGFL